MQYYILQIFERNKAVTPVNALTVKRWLKRNPFYIFLKLTKNAVNQVLSDHGTQVDTNNYNHTHTNQTCYSPWSWSYGITRLQMSLSTCLRQGLVSITRQATHLVFHKRMSLRMFDSTTRQINIY